MGDYLSAPLAKIPFLSLKSYVGGSKALDSLVKLIASTESFFHPSNSGAWTADVCNILKRDADISPLRVALSELLTDVSTCS